MMTEQEMEKKVHEIYQECQEVFTLENAEVEYSIRPDDDEEDRFNAAMCDFFLGQRYREAGIGK